MPKKDILKKIEEAGLVGRGGAGFPSAIKWKTVKNACSDKKYLICNVSEGELGLFKDIYIIKNFADQVIRGMTIAMDYVDTKEAYFNFNTNYYKEVKKSLHKTLKPYEEKGYKFTIFQEKPSYIGGEETALMEAIEGRPAQPRLKPPYPGIKGLFGKPTLIHNVETLFNIAAVEAGTFENKRFYCISGEINNKGVYHLPADLPIHEILKKTYNIPEFDYFMQIGGSASGLVINKNQAKKQTMTGAGSIEVYRANMEPKELLHRWFKFYKAESCGKCTPCHDGSAELYDLLKNSKKIPWEKLMPIVETMEFNSFCALGRSVANPIKSYLENVLNLKIKYKKHETLPIHKLASAIEFDPELCIACEKCVIACEGSTGHQFLEIYGKKSQQKINYTPSEHIDCIYCGQCTLVCPANAIRPQSEIEQVEAEIKDKNIFTIVQMAPSVRASIGEEFGEPAGTNMEGKMYTALRKVGFDKVFDVNMGADITTIVEAEELIERIQNNGVMPMFTSCCPAWVKFVEFYHPELIPHLTTSRSPQMHSGGAYKTWWAEKHKIDPAKIRVISIMPCTSKKYEAKHEKMKINGHYPVDHVLTVREAAELLKRSNIHLPDLENSKADDYGVYSGAAAIYGASGGVMESALRTAHDYLTGKNLKKIEYHKVRGIQGIKRAKVKIGKTVINIAVINVTKNMKEILHELKKNIQSYDYIEVMACPGGCIGGGGQPIPTNEEIIKKRAKALYQIDTNLKMRKAHENPVVKKFFKEYIKKADKHTAHSVLHTDYRKRRKSE